MPLKPVLVEAMLSKLCSISETKKKKKRVFALLRTFHCFCNKNASVALFMYHHSRKSFNNNTFNIKSLNF